MEKRKGIVWKNCVILMSFFSVVIITIAILMYRSAVSVISEEICNINQNRAALAENNLSTVIQQCDRLTSTFYVKEDVRLFYGLPNPEAADDNYYYSLYSDLLTCRYSFRNFIHSIVLYAPAYNRVFSDNSIRPYVIREGVEQSDYDIRWIKMLPEIDEEKRVCTSLFFRAWNDSYPYLMTLVKQYNLGGTHCVVSVDVDLEKLYNNVWLESKDQNNVSVWIVNHDGNVVIRENKKHMYEPWEEFDALSSFTKTVDAMSVIQNQNGNPVVFSQRYLEEYDLYVAVVTELENFNNQISAARLKAIFVGLACVVLCGVLVWIYVSFANKPIKSILSLLENPLDYHAYTKQSEREVQAIVDGIVSSLQTNEMLRQQLNQRLDILRETQIQALKVQINPHFLFNTLNAIVMLIDEEVEDSRSAQITTDLSDFLRYSLSNDNLVSLKEEIENTNKYIYIMEQRYQGYFQTKITIDPELLEAKVPKLLLQPLIENAIFHGIVASEVQRMGYLTITGTMHNDSHEGNMIAIEITDNGHGMSEEDIRRIQELIEDEHISMRHIGIQNVAKRLALLFPGKSELKINSKKGEGTHIVLHFPVVM